MYDFSSLVYRIQTGARSQLVVSAARGDLTAVTRELQGGANPNVVDVNGATPVTAAVSSGRSDILQRLLAAGATLDESIDGWSTLGIAIACQRRELAEFLLNLGVEPNKPCSPEWTPLTLAAYIGDTNVVRLLLRHGANPNLCDPTGRPALVWASWRLFRRVCGVLQAAGADLTITSRAASMPTTASQVPPMRRTTPRIGRSIVSRLLERLVLSGATRRELHGLEVAYVEMSAEAIGQASVALEGAFSLLARQGKAFQFVRGAFSRLVVGPWRPYRAGYDVKTRWCIVDWGATPPSELELACLLVHEATHSRLVRMGFGYGENERVRIERACIRNSLKLSDRISQDGPISRGLRLELLLITPESLSNASIRAKVLSQLGRLTGLGQSQAVARIGATVASLVAKCRAN